MQSSPDVPLDRPFPTQSTARETLVQDRPTLGAMPMARRGPGIWLVPAIDLVSSSVALMAVAALAGTHLLPAFPVAPLILVAVYALLGVYGSSRSARDEGGAGWPVIRFIVAGLFVWIASLLTTLGSVEQLGLWLGFIALDTVSRMVVSPYLERLNPQERWVLVGEYETAERLRAYEPLKKYANVVGTVPPSE